MKQHPERFTRAIKALLNSFLKETLAKGNCAACAVGNIIAHVHDAKVLKTEGRTIAVLSNGLEFNNSNWKYVFATFGNPGRQYINSSYYKGGIKNMIDKTGYSYLELAQVEKAFELNTKIHNSDYKYNSKENIIQDQYNGLMAVVDVLCEIEGLNEEKENFKKLFNYEGI